MTMRAMTYAAVPGDAVVADLERPEPQAGEVLVKVDASSVNGFDIATVNGYLLQMMEHRFPLVPGKDFAGTIAALGDEVEGLSVGDPVFGVVMKPFLGTGSMAQYLTVPAGTVAAIPEGVDMVTAGALGLAGTAALNAVDALDLQPGQTVLVIGATGGVGALAVQYAAARGATVIATARPGDEATFVQGRTTATVTVVDYTGDLAAQVTAITPAGLDAIAHFAGPGDVLADLVVPGGRIASTLGFGPDAVGGRDITVTAVMADPNPDTLRRLADDVASGVITVPVTATYPSEQAGQAYTDFTAGTRGKLAITLN